MRSKEDQQIVDLAKAIRLVESGGFYDAKGASGEVSAYQFMPSTWKLYAKQILGDENAPMTKENQNKVVFQKIKAWKEQGFNVGNIASMWNAGEAKPNAYLEDWRGVNKYGVAFDTPAYAEKVATAYQGFKSESAVLTKRDIDRPSIIEVKEEVEEKKNNIFQDLFTSLIGRPAIRFGQAIGMLGVEKWGTEEQKKRAYEYIGEPVELPLGLGTVQPVKTTGKVRELGPISISDDAIKQITGESLETAAWLMPSTKAMKLTAPFKAKIPALFATGFAFGSGSSLKEGNSYKEAAVQGSVVGITNVALGGVANAISKGATNQIIKDTSVYGKIKAAYVKKLGEKGQDQLIKNIAEINKPLIKSFTNVVKTTVMKEWKEAVSHKVLSGISLAALTHGATAPFAAKAAGAHVALTFLTSKPGQQFMMDIFRAGLTSISKIDEPMRSEIAVPFITMLINEAVESLSESFDSGIEEVD